MANFLRALLGLALLPACLGMALALTDAIRVSTMSQGFSLESLSLFFGMMAFILCWALVPRPVRTYVLGHELTHALWGLLFGAVPSDLKVGKDGGSVRLTKSNFLITLAPYFFPFYTFVVIVAALISLAFWRPLPVLPLWMFMIGFTWAFHVLFTVQTLAENQPDIRLYGKLFSWSFIFIVNVVFVLLWMVATTDITFGEMSGFVIDRTLFAYGWVVSGVVWLVEKSVALFRRGNAS